MSSARSERTPRRRGPTPTAAAPISTREDAPAEDPLVLATLRVRITPKVWVGRFSRAHPELEIELMNRTDVGAGISVADFWIGGREGGRWTPEIGRFPEVERADCLGELGPGFVYRIRFASSPIVAVYRELGLTYQFPFRIQAGIIFWEIAARASQFRRVLDFLRTDDPQLSIVSIRRRGMRSHLPNLTDLQRSVLATALAEGYFAVPRAISLTGLAKKLGRSKSTLSESLAVIEQRILESASRPPATFQ